MAVPPLLLLWADFDGQALTVIYFWRVAVWSRSFWFDCEGQAAVELSWRSLAEAKLLYSVAILKGLPAWS